MPEAIANQVGIHYESAGSGPPLLFLHGLVDSMPTAQMVVIENAHHAVPVERPKQFNKVLEDFLSD
jgi:pimeloyl-ACP methyl ester carboxylesterase